MNNIRRRHAGRFLRRMTWAAVLAVVVPLLSVPAARADGEEYPEDLVVRAAQASEAIEASGVDPNDASGVRTVLEAMSAAGLSGDGPFPDIDPSLADQLVIFVPPPPGGAAAQDCRALREARLKAEQLQVATVGIGAGYTLILGFAQSSAGSAISMLVPQLRIAVLVMAVVNFAVAGYRYGIDDALATACEA